MCIVYFRFAKISSSSLTFTCSKSSTHFQESTLISPLVLSSVILISCNTKSLELNVISAVVVFTKIEMSTRPENEGFTASKFGTTLSAYHSGSVSSGNRPKSKLGFSLYPLTCTKTTRIAIYDRGSILSNAHN